MDYATYQKLAIASNFSLVLLISKNMEFKQPTSITVALQFHFYPLL